MVKKDAHLAPVNYFVAQKRRREQQQPDPKGTDKEGCDVIELDDEGGEVQFRMDRSTSVGMNSQEDDVSHWGAQG